MNRLLLFWCFLFIGHLMYAQSNRAKEKVSLIKRYDYKIEVSIWNGLFKINDRYILDNTTLDSKVSVDSPKSNFKPFTLYYLSYKPGQQEDLSGSMLSMDTTVIKINEVSSDRLFQLAREFFKSIQIEHVDTAVSGVVYKKAVTDDSQVEVELTFDGLKLTASAEAICSSNFSDKFTQLLSYINKLSQAK